MELVCIRIIIKTPFGCFLKRREDVCTVILKKRERKGFSVEYFILGNCLQIEKKLTISRALMQVTVLNLLNYPTFCCFCVTGRKPSSSIHSERWGLQTAHGHHAGGVQQRAREGDQPHRQGQNVPHLRQGRPRRIR